MKDYVKIALAKKIAKNKYNEYENITVRLHPVYCGMLAAISSAFNIKYSSFFTEIISENLNDLVVSLKEQDQEVFFNRFEEYLSFENFEDLSKTIFEPRYAENCLRNNVFDYLTESDFFKKRKEEMLLARELKHKAFFEAFLKKYDGIPRRKIE